MELLFASGVGILTAIGIYLTLRERTFPVIVGVALLTYAVNLFLFSSGRLAINQPPYLAGYYQGEPVSDPLPQALVLTAIVISFAMSAVVVIIALGGFLSSEDDRIDLERDGDAD